jgi:nucleotide-binding universal stress UspA family protein
MFPTKVLVAVDGSAESARAARMAVTLSNSLDSELQVVHVGLIPSAPLESAILGPGFQGRMRERVERSARERLEEQVREIGEAGGRIAEAHARVGRPDAEIVHLAEELGAGLLVVGSRGFGAFKRALMGSVSSSVVRHARGSVLVVRGDGRGEREYLPGRILLAFDGSKEAVAARAAAVEIAGGTGSELHILYVLQTQQYMPYQGPEVREGWRASLERAKRYARSFVNEQAERIEAEGGKVAGAHAAFGKPDDEMVKLSEELDAGLIVMGSRGLGGVRRALMGSVSDSVVRHAHRPVMVARRAEGP